MTPEQLAHLTDAERRAWEACEAATPGPWTDKLASDRKAERNNWRDVYAGNRPVVVPGYYERHSAGETETECGVQVSKPDAALIALSRTALPAALEALADARAARDVEEQLRCVADDERARAERDADDARRERDEARARVAGLEALLDRVPRPTAITPGEDPAPHVAGAPDAAGGALGVGVGLTNCDNCAHDYSWPSDPAPRLCRLTRTHEATRMWSVANCDVDGAPIPGATGCPGYSPRTTYATDATEEADE